MNQATFQIDEPSNVKLVQEKDKQEKDKQEKDKQEKDDTEKVDTEKVKQAETTKNSAITTSNTHIKPKPPIKKVENIYYL